MRLANKIKELNIEAKVPFQQIETDRSILDGHFPKKNPMAFQEIADLTQDDRDFKTDRAVELAKWFVDQDSRHLATAAAMGKELKVFAEKKDFNRGYEILHLMVCQNLFVTQTAVVQVAIAGQHFPEGKEAVDRFVKSELGHDVFVLQTLQEIPIEREYRVLDSVKNIMGILRFSAENNFLALAVATDLLEGTDVTEKDNPESRLWDLFNFLPNSEKILAGVRRHDRINRSENHQNISADFLRGFGHFSRETFFEALEILEDVIQEVALLNLYMARALKS